ncbi:MAG: hypothetical protein R3D61_01535 [Defluviimonas denitrificans]
MTIRLPRPVLDANATAGGGLGKLPDWDLSDLYTAPDAPELIRDMDWLEGACASFAADYEGRLAALDAGAMLDCIHRFEKIEGVAGRIMSYAGLRYYQNTIDGARAEVHVRLSGQDHRLYHAACIFLFGIQPDRG